MIKVSKKIFITGSNGFIGKNLKEQLSKQYEVIAPTHNELELLNEEQVSSYLKKHQFDIVIHTATHNATRTSLKDLSRVFYSNLRMFFNLARCNQLYKRMFYFGSGAEYDNRYYTPKIKEDFFDKHVPVDDYGFSKYIMAKYISNTNNLYDLRLFGCFGKFEDWRIRFISNACCFAIHNMDIIMKQNVYFDYLYVNDLARIMQKFIEAKKIPYHYYNVCTGRIIDLLSLAKLVIKISGKKIKIKIKQEGFKKEYSGDNFRLLKFIGGFKFTPIEKSIRELYQWYRANKRKIDKSVLEIYK